ncbi:MAG: hypothetical protein AAGF11_35875 [Myxococcota bacterium]
MARWWIGVCAAVVACTVEVDEGNTGLSAGMSGPGSGMTAGAEAGAEAGSMAATDESATMGAPTVGGSTASVDDSGPGPGTTMGTATDDGVPSTGEPPGSTDDAPGDPLDPGLDVPEDGEPCLTPGSLPECPKLEVCRFHTTEQGLCESCVGCGNLGAPCVQGPDCDILFACYLGQCTNFCSLGTSECGPIEDCLNVGHPTHGVCAPF